MSNSTEAKSLLSSGAMLFISMTVVNAGNYLINLVMGRWLGPAAFSDLSLIVTLMLMVTFITVTLQLTSAKFAAEAVAREDKDELRGLRNQLLKWAWIAGGVGSAVLAFGSIGWQSFFHTQSAWPFVILGIALPLYFVQGVERGILQGQTRFGQLAWSYQAEMWVRLVGSVLLVWAGFGVNGAVVAISLSFIATWLFVRNPLEESQGVLSAEKQEIIQKYAVPVIIANISQILINNSDVLIVKRFFNADDAGLYAALALIGRVVFFATWSVVTTLFPIIAQKVATGKNHRILLWGGLGCVGVVSAGIIGASVLFPEWIVNILFGEEYLSIAPLLWLYAIATSLYALSNVVIMHWLSADKHGGTYIAIVAGIIQVGTLWLFHDSLRQIVLLQIGLMAGLFIALMIWNFYVENEMKKMQV